MCLAVNEIGDRFGLSEIQSAIKKCPLSEFTRAGRAGNISKRQSATDFQYSGIGGSCPLWNVYEAFSRPGEVLSDLTRIPDLAGA